MTYAEARRLEHEAREDVARLVKEEEAARCSLDAIRNARWYAENRAGAWASVAWELKREEKSA